MIEQRCNCGAKILGTSESQIKHNMKIHKMSKKHKELMEIKLNKLKNDN